MKKESPQELPYEENEKSFGEWFRSAAKDKWTKYLSGNEMDITSEERDAMRKFLIEQGTKDEIRAKLDSFLDHRILSYDALMEELRSKRPDISLD